MIVFVKISIYVDDLCEKLHMQKLMWLLFHPRENGFLSNLKLNMWGKLKPWKID